MRRTTVNFSNPLYILIAFAAGCGAENAEWDSATATQIQALSDGTSSDAPYLVPLMPGVSFQALLTVGDSPAKATYPLVGIPDGIGAYASGNGKTFNLFVNHELTQTAGAVHAHGAKGAFVSKWKVETATGKVLDGADLIQTVVLWNTSTNSYDPPALGVAMGRLCSADLAPTSAFYDSASGLGHDDRFFMSGEEIGFGRGFAHDVESGISYDLPRLGKVSYENILARPNSGVKTVVAGLDDSTPGRVNLYVGTKTAEGSPIDKAGLTNGSLFGVKVTGFPSEPASGIPSGTPVEMFELGDVSNTSGAALLTVSTANGVTLFDRPEDGAWNPSDRNELFFVTTASFTRSTRLWSLKFADATNPAAGGTIDLLVDGATTIVDGAMPKMFDNIAATNDGSYVYLQEDPGNQAHLAKIWRYNAATGALELVAQHDPARFVSGSPTFLTQDEESSGIMDAADVIGPGKFLLDVEVHKAHPDPTLVEPGQLLVMTVNP